jgi:hypothetical protein
LDFHDLHVDSIRAALEAAYEAGANLGRRQALAQGSAGGPGAGPRGARETEMTKRETTNEAYGAAQQTVLAELERIKARLAEHGRAYQRVPGNWDYVGDLNQLASSLKELLPDTQPGDRFVWREGDVQIIKPGVRRVTPKYPIVVRLVGEDGNAFAILRRDLRAMKAAGLPREITDAFIAEAMASGSHDALLQCALRWVDVT